MFFNVHIHVLFFNIINDVKFKWIRLFVNLHVQYNDTVFFVQFQRKKIHEFCAKYRRHRRKFAFPPEKEQRQELFRHLLYNDQRRIIFCFVEANCHTDTKHLVLNLNYSLFSVAIKITVSV